VEAPILVTTLQRMTRITLLFKADAAACRRHGERPAGMRRRRWHRRLIAAQVQI
jgi:hypothetical protein